MTDHVTAVPKPPMASHIIQKKKAKSLPSMTLPYAHWVLFFEFISKYSFTPHPQPSSRSGTIDSLMFLEHIRYCIPSHLRVLLFFPLLSPLFHQISVNLVPSHPLNFAQISPSWWDFLCKSAHAQHSLSPPPLYVFTTDIVIIQNTINCLTI